MVLQLCLAVGLAISVSALCSIIEAVLYSTPASHVEVMADSGKRSGLVFKKLRSEIQQPITAILTLNTISHTMGAAIAGASAAVVFGEHNLGWFSLLFTLAILIFSEILPKTIGVAYSRSLAPWIAFPLQWLVNLLTPVVWLCRIITNLIPLSTGESLVSAEEVQAIASLSRKSGEIDLQQERVINNMLELKNTNVRQVMTPGTVVYFLSEHIDVAEAMTKKKEWDRHSRIPVYDKSPDDIVGIVLGKDILLCAADGEDNRKLATLIHSVHFVPAAAPLDRVLLDFFEYHQHLFVVVDEYGSVTGIISLEDIIEEIVGREIMDESDKTVDMRELARRKRRKIIGRLG